MLYSTIVQRDESGLEQIYEAAKEFEDLNLLEAILSCNFDICKVKKTLFLVRMYQQRLNLESMELAEFSEHFIEEYATDHNKCFRIALRLVKKIGTTITGSMKLFRKYCPVVRKRLEGTNNVVPVLDYSRLTFRHYHGMFFGEDPYVEEVKTLLHEQATFFYHLVAVLALCKDMIRQEEDVKGDFERLKEIFEKSCDKVLHCVSEVYNTFGKVKLISDEELAERRKNARPMKEWLAKDYHAHDKQWLKREGYLYRLVSGRQYGLDEKASVLWAKNPEWGRKVCGIILKLDTLGIPFKHSKKAEAEGKKGTFDAREMVYLVKWSGVSSMSDDGKNVIDEANERQFYFYLQEKYKGEFMLPSWQAVCRERKFCYQASISAKEMISNFSKYLSAQTEVA